MATTFESHGIDVVRAQLMARGWAEDDILVLPALVWNGSRIQPDLVLCRAHYPLFVVEVKSIAINDLAGAFSQVARYTSILGVSHGFATDGQTIVQFDTAYGDRTVLPEFPSPEEYWQSIGRDWDIHDTRLSDGGPSPQGRLLQVLAIGRILDALITQKRALAILATGSGVSFVFYQLTMKLLRSGQARKILHVYGTRMLVEQAAQQFGRQSHHYVSTSLKHEASIEITTSRTLLNNQHAKLAEFATDHFDHLIFHNSALGEDVEPILRHFPNATAIAHASSASTSVTIGRIFGAPVFVYSYEDIIEGEVLAPPEGFRAVRIGSVARVDAGVNPAADKFELTESPQGVPIIFASDLLEDGSIATNRRFESPHMSGQLLAPYQVQKDDVLISRLSSPNRIRVALVSAELEKALVSTTLLRVRVQQPDVRGVEVFRFLDSLTGQRYLRAAAEGHSVARLTTEAVEGIPLLLADIPQPSPESSTPPQETPPPLSKAAQLLQYLQQHVLPKLNELKDSTQPVEDHEFDQIAARLRAASNDLVPPKLPERVITGFPTPIALAYLRFTQARYNTFEAVLRLRDVFEAIGYFVYHVVLADAFHRLDRRQYHVPEKVIRQAYNDYSMASRMDFVKKILDVARANGGRDLYFPQLIHTEVASTVREFQSDFRNRFSHTAAATESQQQRLIAQFLPQTDKLLGELEFLSQCRMGRIRGFHWKRGRLVRTMELHLGASPRLEEEFVDEGESVLRADRDHVVLINLHSGALLDLHPLYQMIASEQTRHESHLCVLKQRKGQRGESVVGAFEVSLEGMDELDALRQVIEAQ